MHSRPQPITWKGGTTSLYKPGVLAGVTSVTGGCYFGCSSCRHAPITAHVKRGGSLRDSKSSAGGCPCDQIEFEGTGGFGSLSFTITVRGRPAVRSS
jgi:hypothetical protein